MMHEALKVQQGDASVRGKGAGGARELTVQDYGVFWGLPTASSLLHQRTNYTTESVSISDKRILYP